ncbi:alpha/beta hydrolase [Kitasatospora cystarginea]|uniref:Alpha/beta hydrolase n=1 Tax=Kitasatospora cystarginea TaxID=58350 RepID=A0ABP5RQ98_9ACTN
MRHRKTTRAALCALAAVGLLTPSATAQAAPAAARKASTAPGITWERCAGTDESDTVRCGAISLPLDWSRPGSPERTEVRVARLPAADPGRRVGTLFFNPGGPGDGEVGYLLDGRARQQYFPAALRERFDIVAVDPRGTGTNPPLHCRMPIDPAVSRFPADRAAAADLVRSNRRLGTACARAGGPLVEHLDTGTIARDMDAVRASLGERRISFLGISYGSMVAQSYAELFPGRVRAMVVDGVVDRALPWQRMAVLDAAAVEDGVGRFAQWSAGHPESALHGQDVSAFLPTLLRRADAGEIKDGERPARAEEIAQAVNSGLQMPAFYPMLATALRRTAETGSLAPLGPLTPAQNPEYPAYRSIVCQDVPVPAGAEAALPELARRVREAAPTLRGYSEFWDIASGCAGWPGQSCWTPHGWRVPADFPPVLLLSGAHDVATPPAFAESVRRALPGSRLLRWEGDGHTAWANSPATVDAAVGYLADLAVPPTAS